MKEKTYIAIDLKSFYASVECVERGLDPLGTHLVVADESRSSKTICLAVSPPLKALGVSSRPRLFEVEEEVRYINALRRQKNGHRNFIRGSHIAAHLEKYPCLKLDYIVAAPRMASYIDYSRRIYGIYKKYVAPEDIHVYSIDEVFIDASPYLKKRSLTAYDLVEAMISEIIQSTGITATAGIGSNLYLAKVAMDIVAKHCKEDQHGVRIAQLDEIDYREKLWNHRPLEDFWRVGRGYARKLEAHGMYTMGDVARRSLEDEDLLYKLFGVNAELLIDHAWGSETCTMEDIKSYRPKSSSFGSSQVLPRPYSYDQAKVVLYEMGDQLALDLVNKGYLTNQVSLSVSFDKKSLEGPDRLSLYQGLVAEDFNGRPKPKSVHSRENLLSYTASSLLIVEALVKIYQRLVDPYLLIRKIGVRAQNVCREEDQPQEEARQLKLFPDPRERETKEYILAREKERRLQEAFIQIKKRFGKNAIMKGINFQEGATGRERNQQIGGHKAW